MLLVVRKGALCGTTTAAVVKSAVGVSGKVNSTQHKGQVIITPSTQSLVTLLLMLLLEEVVVVQQLLQQELQVVVIT